ANIPSAISNGPIPPHFPARAKRVIFIFCNGGPPHLDTFDPKEPATRGKDTYASQFKFERYGSSGLPVSEVFHNVGSCADDLFVIRSMSPEAATPPAPFSLMTCAHRPFPRPSFGAWVSYGLGSKNKNPPAYIAFGDGHPLEGARQFGNGF